MEKDFKTISIPGSIYRKIEIAIKGTEMTSVSSYIVKAVREAFSKDESRPRVNNKDVENKVKERLKTLGYID